MNGVHGAVERHDGIQVALHGAQHRRVVEDEPEGREAEQGQGECRVNP
jgi:hypothetical protein